MMFGGGNTGNIGALDGFVSVPYDAGTNKILDHLNTNYYHVHGTPFVYPDHADDVTLSSSAAAWSQAGTITEVIPADTLTTAGFDIHWINVSNITSNATIQIDIFAGESGSEVLIGSTRASRTTNQARNGPSRIQIPQQVLGTRISCRLSDSTSSSVSVDVSFEGHFYAG